MILHNLKKLNLTKNSTESLIGLKISYWIIINMMYLQSIIDTFFHVLYDFNVIYVLQFNQLTLIVFTEDTAYYKKTNIKRTVSKFTNELLEL